jgi:hypothetical protein
MNAGAPLDCAMPARRGRLLGSKEWNGIDFVDVSLEQKSLCIHFFNGVPSGIGLENIRISGGRRIRDVRPVRVFVDKSRDAALDDCLRVEVDKAGDLSTYRLCLIGRDGAPIEGIDPRYACIDFGFRIDCAGALDCLDDAPCEPPAPENIEIDYLAKDYSSFLRLIYDRLALVMPEWRERHAPDLGVTLVEILAYVGDYLSYYQDAVATEAYLGTARRRVSVRRHLRLIDYHLHEGCNARAFVAVKTESDFSLKAGDFYFSTDPDGLALRQGALVDPSGLGLLGEGCEIFEPVGDPAREIAFRAARSRILIHDWGEEECCLPEGSTSATLVDAAAEWPKERCEEAGGDGEGYAGGETDGSAEHADPPEGLGLEVGDYLIFEEAIGPGTGNPADADPARRHAVRLTSVARGRDDLLGVPIVEIGWAKADALPFALCLSVRRPAPDCDLIREVSVARGNVVPVDHGRRLSQPLGAPEARTVHADCACEGSILECVQVPLAFAPGLEGAPLTFAAPADLSLPAAIFLAGDPRRALPCVALREEGEGGASWWPRRDLLSSGGDERHFVAEIDDEGRASLRFGDGKHGRRPDPGIALAAAYRRGNGASGNVDRGAIRLMALRSSSLEAGKISVSNPLPAVGGAAPEPSADAKLLGPGSIFARRERAVAPEDYAELALRSPEIQSAAAALRWAGSWYEARLAIDPLDAQADDPNLSARVAGLLHPARRIGHDLAVSRAVTVPIQLAIEICVAPHHQRGHVYADLLDAFSARRIAGGRTGFFHPDRLRFGDDVHVSRIVAAAMAVEGVESARVAELRRMNGKDEGALDTGRLEIGPGEVARLDNDPNFPENGQLRLDMGGGR